MADLEKKMDYFKNKITEIYSDPKILLIGMILIFIFFAFTYVYLNIRKRSNNCTTLSKNISPTSIIPMNQLNNYNSTLKTEKLNNYFIKTAYNCCCTGNIKNDYVDNCGLDNCAKYGVRALDFQIYTLNDKPIISASSLSNDIKNFKYKELYNSLPFGETMTYVKQAFLNNQNNCKNTTDPLFLIFRLYTNMRSSMDIMYDSLMSTFDKSNYLFYMPGNSTLDDISLNAVMGKVVIIVDATGSSNYSSSKLYKISSLNLGTQTNRIYRETEIINDIVNTNINDENSGTNIFSSKLNILYPDLNGVTENYDSITSGMKSGVQFIAMNYQLNDEYLIQFENKFKNKSSNNSATSMILKSSIIFN
jgi:hypothetical protein